MKKFKDVFRRAMSLFLAFAMVFTSTPTGAFAQGTVLEATKKTVQFFVSYGEEAPAHLADKDQKILTGEKAVDPQLVIEGFTLGDWHVLSTDGAVSETAYSFDTPVEQDLALVAKATANAQTLDETVVEGTQPIAPENGTEGTVVDDTQKDIVADDTGIDEPVVDDTVIDETVIDEPVVDDTQNETVLDETQVAAPFALGDFGSNSNLLEKHAVLAISSDNRRQPNEPSLNTQPFNLYSNGAWLSDGERGHANCSHDKCYTSNVGSVLTADILDKLIKNGSGETRVNGYADANGIDAYFTDDFKNNVLPTILQQYLDRYNKGASAKDYTMVFYVAKYQSNDNHWHIDGTVVKKSMLSVKYDKNGDDVTGVAPDHQIDIAKGSQYTVQNNVSLEREGFTFAGWNTQSNGKGIAYKANDKITVNENITLYAVWNQDKTAYTVTVNLYNKDYGTATDKDLMDTKTTSVQYNLIASLMKKDSEELFEQFWSSFDANEEDFYSENPYWTPNAPNKNEKNYIVNIYMKDRTPEGMLRTIGFKNAVIGGTMSPNEASFTVMRNTLWSKADITIPTVTASENYEFLGWRENGGTLYTNEQVAARNATINTSRTYTAEYKLKVVIEKASVSFTAGNGGKFVGTTETSVTFADKIVGKTFAENTITVPTPVANEGYYFTGWTPATPNKDTVVNKGQEGNAYTATFAQKTAITITSASGTKTYNGADQSITGVSSINGLTFKSADGTALTATAKGKNAGDYATIFNMDKNKVRVFKNGTDVTEQYTITLATGKLVIEKLDITLKSATASWTFDGEKHSSSNVTVAAGKLPQGVEINYTNFAEIGEKVGNKTNTFDFAFANDNANNYNVKTEFGKITITKRNVNATTDSYIGKYNGDVHSASLIRADGLPIGFVMEQDPNTKFPTITDVGEIKNKVDVLIKKRGDANTIYNDCFNISIAYGKLLVIPRDITVAAQGGTFAYDGTVHTGDATVTVDKFAHEEGIKSFEILGGIKNVGKSTVSIGNIEFLEGTKATNYKITKIDGEVEVIKTDAQNLTIKLNDQTTVYNGKTQSASDKDFYTISNGKLANGEKLELELNGSGKDADTYAITAKAVVKDANGNNVSENYVINVTSGNLTINPAPLKVTVGTKERVYNGEMLTAEGITATIEGLQGDDDITVSSKGETLIDTVATSDTTIAAKDNTKLSNYIPTIVEGKLVITQDVNKAMKIAIKGENLVKFYDGAPLNANATLAEGTLANGDEIKLVNNAAITDAGKISYKPEVEIWHKDASGTSVKLPNYCYNVKYTNGQLQVKQRNVVITANGGEKAYDGTPLTAESMGYTTTAFDTNEGGNGFVGGQDVANVVLTGEITFGNSVEAKVASFDLTDGTNKANYNITRKNGTLAISNNAADRMNVMLTAGSTSKVYDGTALVANNYSATNDNKTFALHTGDKLEVFVDGTITNVFENATGNNTITGAKVIREVNGKNVDVTKYYNIEKVNGTLAITPKPVSIVGNTIAYTVDNNSHTITGARVNDLANGFAATVPAATATRTLAGVTYMGLNTASEIVVTNNANGRSYLGNAANTYARNYVVNSVTDGSITMIAVPTPPVGPGPIPAPPVAPVPPVVVPPVAQEEVIPEQDAPAAAPEEQIDDTEAPKAGADGADEELIEETDAPKAAPSAWALINLLLAVATVLGSVTLLITYFARKKREEEAKAQNANEETRKAVKRRGAMRILSLIPSLASVIAFILTENMKNPMIFVDKWTVLMVVIAVVQIVVMILAKKKIENEEKGKENA